jgi:exo-beta-1,3-glucanase (GH17 family)
MFHAGLKAGFLAIVLSCTYCWGLDLAFVEEGAAADQKLSHATESGSDLRKFLPFLESKWIGQGISYGPYREGQAPGGPSPTREELVEDLNLISQHWNLLRMYGAGDVTEQVLKIIHQDKLPLRVMLGAWISRETQSEELSADAASAAREANQSEVAAVIRLAKTYPDEVLAISVGNETQVYWSDHITKPEILIRYLREVRGAVSVPIATADDFNFWNKPESKAVAAEVDFIVTHVHSMWAGLLPSTAMQWTESIYAAVCAYHPEKMIVIGEAGWATQVHNEGEQAKLIKGEAGEGPQLIYYQQFSDWADEKKVCTFFFEAFDEPWKGGPHANEVEKHWGLFHVDRSPKAAMLPSDPSQ